MVALSTPRIRSPVEQAGSNLSRARACQRKALRNALLTCRPTTQMRLRVMGQMAKGLVNEQNMTSAHTEDAAEELDTVDVGKELERMKWFLWHGNVVRALDAIEDIEGELDFLPQDGESRKKLRSE